MKKKCCKYNALPCTVFLSCLIWQEGHWTFQPLQIYLPNPILTLKKQNPNEFLTKAHRAKPTRRHLFSGFVAPQNSISRYDFRVPSRQHLPIRKMPASYKSNKLFQFIFDNPPFYSFIMDRDPFSAGNSGKSRFLRRRPSPPGKTAASRRSG